MRAHIQSSSPEMFLHFAVQLCLGCIAELVPSLATEIRGTSRKLNLRDTREQSRIRDIVEIGGEICEHQLKEGPGDDTNAGQWCALKRQFDATTRMLDQLKARSPTESTAEIVGPLMREPEILDSIFQFRPLN